MKKHVLSILLLSCILTGLSAQSIIFEDTIPVAYGFASDDEVAIYISMTNNTAQTLDLRWERSLEDTPEPWDSWVCTVPGACGLPDTETLDFSMGPGEIGEFQYHFAPYNITGTGAVRIDIIENGSNELLQTLVITTDLTTVSTNEITAKNIKIFPNPSSDYFQLTDETVVDEIIIYNILGRQVKYFNEEKSQYFVGDLPKGIYLVELFDIDSDSSKTIKLKKN